MARKTASILVLATLVIVAGCAGGGSAPASPPRGGGGAGGGADAPGPGTAGAQSVGSHYADGERVVVRIAELAVRTERFDRSFDAARQAARRHGGFVADWTVENERGYHDATLTIRVPAGQFNDLRDELADLGTLEEESVEAADFTTRARSQEGTLEVLRQRAADLRASIAETENESVRRQLRDELHDVRTRIEEVEREHETLERRASLSTITLTLREPPGQQPPKNYETAYGFDDAFLEAFYGGLAVLKGVVVLLGYLVPVALSAIVVGLVGVLCARLGRRTFALVGVELGSPVGNVGGGGGDDGTD